MPVSPTYPGVYIEEVPSSVRTITGVATSITAFVGRALRGPVDQPLRISSWGDFERKYGGLWQSSTMSYAVQQYFLNGGTDAVIARLVHTHTPVATPAVEARLGSATGSERWTFQAANAGIGGDDLTLTIAHSSANPSLFDITIDNGTDPPDVVTGLDVTTLSPGHSIGPNGHITVENAIPSIRPDAGVFDLAGGADAAVASAAFGAVVFNAATTGAGGNSLTATVGDATQPDGSPGNPANYDLVIELQDDDGDLLASVRYRSIVPGGPWPAVLAADFVGTTDHLIDVVSSGNAPAGRPANGTQAFAGGSSFERASFSVGITIAGLPLRTASPGRWGNNLQAAFDHNTSNRADTNRFNLVVREVAGVREVSRETFRNLSVDPASPRYVVQVLAQESSLVRLPPGTYARPPETPIDSNPDSGGYQWLAFTGGEDGDELATADYLGSAGAKSGMYLLERADLFNLLVIPPPQRESDTDPAVWIEAMKYAKGRRAMLLVDAPRAWDEKDDVTGGLDALGLQGDNATNAAMYWPHAKFADALREYRLEPFPPGGAIAGLMARTDAQRGVWKAPAGIDASVVGARALNGDVTDAEHGQINPLGVNVLRVFPVIGTVAWGARTIRGADALANEWKYVPVRRLALFIEESLYRGTQWAVFEPNDERLWAQLRLNIGSFMANLFRQGAFQGTSPRSAFLVKCDAETTAQNDVDRGIVNVVVGFRPLKVAEFVIIKISQLAGQAGD